MNHMQRRLLNWWVREYGTDWGGAFPDMFSAHDCLDLTNLGYMERELSKSGIRYRVTEAGLKVL